MSPLLNNPLVVLAAVLGLVLSLPVLNLVIKATFYVATSNHKLDGALASAQNTQAALDEFICESREWREIRAERDEMVERTLMLVENDLGVLQDNSGLARREWPDRRTGPMDRRRQA